MTTHEGPERPAGHGSTRTSFRLTMAARLALAVVVAAAIHLHPGPAAAQPTPGFTMPPPITPNPPGKPVDRQEEARRATERAADRLAKEALDLKNLADCSLNTFRRMAEAGDALNDAIGREADESPEMDKARAATNAAAQASAEAHADPGATHAEQNAADHAYRQANEHEHSLRETIEKDIRGYLKGRAKIRAEREGRPAETGKKPACPEPSTTPQPPAPPKPPAKPEKNVHAGLPGGPGLGDDCQSGLLAEVNAARTDPVSFAGTFEGARTPAAGEAVAFMRGHSPVSALTADPLLGGAAARHVADQGPSGLTGHVGTDGSSPRDRIQGAGLYSSMVAEEISLGQTMPSAIVWQLLVDESDAGRRHRADLMNGLFQVMGAACGRHRTWGAMAVIDLSSPIISRPPPPPPPPP
jgi:uncharacterized protein YkwD